MKIENSILELTNWFAVNGLKLHINKKELLNYQSKNSNNNILQKDQNVFKTQSFSHLAKV